MREKFAVIILLAAAAVLCCTACGKKKQLDADLSAHEAIPLWEKEALPFSDVSDVVPELLPYLADTSDPAACMIVCPGGAYADLGEQEAYALDNEGIQPAQALNEKNISAFVLKYRKAPADHNAIMEDILRAIRVVRYYAEALHIDPERVGVMGFSAGGHLALMAMEHFDMKTSHTDDVDDESAKPTLGVLCYPVVSLEEGMTHETTRSNFLGADENDPEMVSFYSGEQGTRADMPPFFVWHCKTDRAAPVEGTLALTKSAEEKGVEVRQQIYDSGSHGAGMAKNMETLSGWFDECVSWLKERNFCK